MRVSVRVFLHRDFVRESGGVIEVGVRSAPEKGRANAEVLRKVARHLGVPSSRVRIVFGHTSRRKVVEVLA